MGLALKSAAAVATTALLVGCGDDASEPSDAESTSAGGFDTTTCEQVGYPQAGDLRDVARAVVDAAQAGDADAVCALIGRPTIPPGLVDYSTAISRGLSTDITLDGRRPDPAARTEAFRFTVPDSPTTRLVLGFQQQQGGQVLFAVFFTP